MFHVPRSTFHEKGFTLLEMLVVMAIVAIMAGALITNFQTARTGANARRQIASVIVSDLRRAQSMALSGTRYNGNAVCGYGVHYINTRSYLIYARNQAKCSTGNTKYQSGTDFTAETRTFGNNQLSIGSFKDIFYEPPDPRVYFDGDSDISKDQNGLAIAIYSGASCATDCTIVTVFKSGAVNSN